MKFKETFGIMLAVVGTVTAISGAYFVGSFDVLLSTTQRTGLTTIILGVTSFGLGCGILIGVDENKG